MGNPGRCSYCRECYEKSGDVVPLGTKWICRDCKKQLDEYGITLDEDGWKDLVNLAYAGFRASTSPDNLQYFKGQLALLERIGTTYFPTSTETITKLRGVL